MISARSRRDLGVLLRVDQMIRLIKVRAEPNDKRLTRGRPRRLYTWRRGGDARVCHVDGRGVSTRGVAVVVRV